MANTYLKVNATNVNGGGGSSDIEWIVATVDPADGGAGVQAGIDAAFAVGGGIVQLLAGDFEIASLVSSDQDMNNVWLRGVGPTTRIIHKGAFNGESILFKSREVVAGLAINNVAFDASQITFTAPGDATNVQTGDRIFIYGTAPDGLIDVQIAFASANGNGGTGVVTLRTNTIRSATSAKGYVYRNGRNNRISDMAFAYETPAPAVDALAIQFRNQESGLVENVVVEESYKDSPSPASGVALINFNGYGFNNEINNAVIENAFETAVRFVGELDSTAENVIVKIAGSADNQPAININETYDCRISKCTVLSCDDIGINVSEISGLPARRAVIERCNILDCTSVGIQSQNSKSIRILNNNIEDTIFGVDIFPGTDIIVQNNIMTRCDEAIRYKTVNGGSISNNTIDDTNAGGNALLVDTTSLNISVTGNNLKDCQASGIFILASSQCTIANNVIDGVVSGAGIRLSNSADNNIIISNSSQNSGGVGILLADDCDNNIVALNNVNGDGITQGAGAGNIFDNNQV